jgi:hypothetical protein
MRRLVLVLFALVFALTVGIAAANAGTGGNSANAKLCQKNGWQTLYRSDGSAFASEEDCVSYAAQGGTLTKKTKSQLDCEAIGGTFSTDPASNQVISAFGGTFLWSCNNSSSYPDLSADCFADGGTSFANTGDPANGFPFYSSCFK